MATLRLKHVHQFVDRNGHARFYFRRAGMRRPLPGLPGSSEFMAAYAGMLGDAAPAPAISMGGVGSVAGAVKGYLASAEFIGLAATTRVARRCILEKFAKEHGHRRIAELERRQSSIPCCGRSPASQERTATSSSPCVYWCARHQCWPSRR